MMIDNRGAVIRSPTIMEVIYGDDSSDPEGFYPVR